MMSTNNAGSILIKCILRPKKGKSDLFLFFHLLFSFSAFACSMSDRKAGVVTLGGLSTAPEPSILTPKFFCSRRRACRSASRCARCAASSRSFASAACCFSSAMACRFSSASLQNAAALRFYFKPLHADLKIQWKMNYERTNAYVFA